MKSTNSNLNLAGTVEISASSQIVRAASSSHKLISPLIVFTVSMIATFLAALAIEEFAVRGSWLHEFFFGRRFVQFLILWMMFHGLIELACRAQAWIRERRGVRAWRSGKVPDSSSGLVCARYNRTQQLLNCAAVTDLRAGTAMLSEQAAAELDAKYSTVNVLVHLASYCGFFGTVLGLSQGLFVAFNGQGGLSMKVFGSAVATSFDTTLAGLACTIVLLIAQNVIRAREEALLAETNSLVDDALLQHDQYLVSTLGLDGATSTTNDVTALLGHGLDAITRQALSIASSVEALSKTAGGLLHAMAKSSSDVEAASKSICGLQESVNGFSSGVAKGLADSRSETKALQEQTKTMAEQCAALKGRIDDLKAAVEKPRRVQVVELA